MSKRFFIFGAGYSGRAIARALAGEADFIDGTTRDEDKSAALRAAGLAPFLFAGGDTPGPELRAALAETSHLIVAAAPDATGDPVLAGARTTIAEAMPKLRWIGYLSTIGVYGDHDGAWVDETSQCRPVSERSRNRLAAEAEWARLGRETGRPVAILRLAGIYGPGRNALVNLSRGTARRIVKPGQVFNRIHVEDIAAATAHLARRREGGIFNVADDAPAPAQDVVLHAAHLMGVDPPPEIPFEQADLSPMGRSFYGECKRAANAKLKATGYRLRHPDYRAALDAMWADGSWGGTER